MGKIDRMPLFSPPIFKRMCVKWTGLTKKRKPVFSLAVQCYESYLVSNTTYRFFVDEATLLQLKSFYYKQTFFVFCNMKISHDRYCVSARLFDLFGYPLSLPDFQFFKRMWSTPSTDASDGFKVVQLELAI